MAETSLSAAGTLRHRALAPRPLDVGGDADRRRRVHHLLDLRLITSLFENRSIAIGIEGDHSIQMRLDGRLLV